VLAGELPAKASVRYARISAAADGAQLNLRSREGFRSRTRAAADGTFTVWAFIPGEHRIFVACDDDRSDPLRDPDFVEDHATDFPTVLVAEGTNPPLLLRLPTR
jgi:hypothetical protein